MAEPILLVIIAAASLVVGGGIAYWMAQSRFSINAAELRAQLETQVATQLQRAESLADRIRQLETELGSANQSLSEARSENTRAREQIAQLETALKHERQSAAEKLAELKDAHERMTAEFKSISSDVLKSNNVAFLDLAKESFGKLQQESKGDLEKRQQAIDLLVKPLRDSLEKVDTKIAEIEKTRAKAYGELGQQLEQLNTAQLRLQAEASRLSTAMRSTSYAGSWGELQLRRVVELADMLPHVDFVEQEGGDGPLRADMIIRLPGGQQIVVDAKTPVQSFRESIEAKDENTRAAILKTHASKVRGHIDALGAKSYWQQYQPAPEFVVLFMPGDHFLTAALQADSTLLERAISRRVLLATPTSLIALLKAAAYGWRQEAVSRNAEEISALGQQLHERLGTFADHLDRIGKGLDAAMKGYNAAVGSFEQSVLPGARKFSDLGAKGSKSLSDPRIVDTAPRQVTKRE